MLKAFCRFFKKRNLSSGSKHKVPWRFEEGKLSKSNKLFSIGGCSLSDGFPIHDGVINTGYCIIGPMHVSHDVLSTEEIDKIRVH